jgi:hypothetical protein
MTHRVSSLGYTLAAYDCGDAELLGQARGVIAYLMGMERSHGELGDHDLPYGALHDALRWEQEFGDTAIACAYRAGDRSVTVEWAELSARVARADKPRLLAAAVSAGALSDVEFRVGLEDAWTTCEWPGRAAEHGVWVELFELAGVDDDR